MFKISSKTCSYILVPVICALFLIACSQQSTSTISGIWRSEGAPAAKKNLVIEFVPDGTGNVFSGSIIGLPAEASIKWNQKGNQIEIQTLTEDPVTQTMTLVSESDNTLEVEVNRTELTLVRVDNIADEDMIESLP